MLEKFELWINGIKKRINPKAYGVGIFVLFGIVCLFGLQMANMYKRSEQGVMDNNNKTLYEIIGYIQNIDVLVEKARVESTPIKQITTYADILRQSNMAKIMLSSLPIDQNSMQGASEFLAQTADFSYSMIKNRASGKEITDEQYDNFEKINEYASKLTGILRRHLSRINIK